jgi:Na+-driven multidrug efflux pump
MVLTLISFWILRLPLAWGLALTSLHALGIWIALPASNVLSAVMAWGYFARGSWQRHDLIGRAGAGAERAAAGERNRRIS